MKVGNQLYRRAGMEAVVKAVVKVFVDCESHSMNDWYKVLTRVGRGDANHGNETSAPVKDGVGEVGVYVGSFRATYLARYSQ